LHATAAHRDGRCNFRRNRGRSALLFARLAVRVLAVLASLGLLPLGAAHACERDEFALFACEAAKGRKFIELCAPSPLDAASGWLVYRFGTADGKDARGTVEFEYPRKKTGSLKQFFAATYTSDSVYTQSVRFVTGGYSYRVYTRARSRGLPEAGVDVHHLGTGKTTTVECSELPRFYIHELKGLVPCDPETPVGVACAQ
jgi:hypothetical protein